MHQEHQASLALLRAPAGLLQQVGERAGQCGIGVVGIAARQPVGEVVVATVPILVDEFAQVGGQCVQGASSL